jgi:hypothetical protein
MCVEAVSRLIVELTRRCVASVSIEAVTCLV